MIEYSLLKEMLCRVLGDRDRENEDYNIILNTERLFRNRGKAKELEGKTFIITNDEISELYKKIKLSNYESDGIALFTGTRYEVAIDLGDSIRDIQEVCNEVSNEENKINYKLAFPTPEYGLFLFMKLIDSYQNNSLNRRGPNPYFRIRHRLGYYLNLNEDIEGSLFEKIASYLIGELSLAISWDNIKSLDDAKNLFSGFAFDFMYQNSSPLVDYREITDIFNLKGVFRNRPESLDLEKAPMRIYAKDVIEYYKLAISSNNPYIEYISYYHVIEYFYDEVFKKRLIDDIKKKITHPSFSHKKDEKIYEVATFIKERVSTDREIGHGKEQESLNFVIEEFISNNITELIQRINDIDTSAKDYYQRNPVPFCNAPQINWGDVNSIKKNIAKRIYSTRNSLVHSKSGRKDKSYKPYKDESNLQKEIPLIKAIAEIIIIYSSSEM